MLIRHNFREFLGITELRLGFCVILFTFTGNFSLQFAKPDLAAR